MSKYFWPMPSTEKFFRNYGEFEIATLATEVYQIINLIEHFNEKHRGNILKNDKGKATLNNIERLIRRLTHSAVPTIEYDKKLEFYLHHPNLYSVIGQILVKDFTGAKSPRRCANDNCREWMVKFRNNDQKYCNDRCGSASRTRKSRKYKKRKIRRN